MTKSHGIENPSDFGKVGVLMGGVSAERDISLNSGNAVLSALLRCNVEAIGIDIGADPCKALDVNPIDRAFIIVHGRGGEDGVLQGLLDSLGIPYTGSGVLGSALAMDKIKTKLCWRGAQIPTPSWCVLEHPADLRFCGENMGFPVIVKPALEGSSLGMNKASNEDELQRAWQEAAKYDCEIFAESWVEGKEYTASIVKNTALPLIRLETPREFYDFDAKYLSDTTQYIVPCGLDRDTEQSIQEMSLNAAKTLGVSGWGRADFLLDEKGKPWFIEVNTIPGLTDHSLVPMAAQAAGINFDELVCKILETSFDADV